MENFLKLTRTIMALTDKELDEVEEIVRWQEEYVHPLKMGTQKAQHELGKYNRQVLNRIKELRDYMLNNN